MLAEMAGRYDERLQRNVTFSELTHLAQLRERKEATAMSVEDVNKSCCKLAHFM